MSRRYRRSDRIFEQLDTALRTVFAPPAHGERDNPGDRFPLPQLTDDQRRDVSGLMRINHTGEVCAQALYLGQFATAKDPAVAEQMSHAAEEEVDHLRWCAQRLDELAAAPSKFNALWYSGAWMLGAGAGLAGDRWSLGFVVETERQVESHLDEHLRRLPAIDDRSRAILRQMRDDEAEHAEQALAAGGAPLPTPIRKTMSIAAGVMKAIVYRI